MRARLKRRITCHVYVYPGPEIESSDFNPGGTATNAVNALIERRILRRKCGDLASDNLSDLADPRSCHFLRCPFHHSSPTQRSTSCLRSDAARR